MELIDVVAKFYEAAANPDIWPDALEALSSAMGCRGALLTTPVFIPGGLVHTNSLRDAVGQFFEEGWYQHDVRNAAVRPHHYKNGFFSDHILFSDREMGKSEYYEKFARKADVPWFAAGGLTGELGRDSVAISLQRTSKQGFFSLDELSTLNTLLPRLAPVMTMASRLAELKGKSMIDGLHLAKQPAVLLNMNGTVAYMNPAAEALIGSRITIRHSLLSAPNSVENKQLQALIDQACAAQARPMSGGQELRPVVLSASETGARLIVRAAPIRRSAADMVAFSGVILMISALTTEVRLPPEILQQVFDLTRREAEVMSLIGEGQPIHQIGVTLGIATETVRYHVKSVFMKTGTTRQSELVGLCSRMSTAVDY
ncbi:helix-turn-helix transcriptional regulator [Rhizobium sp. XQZ8]|uniref:helix-turn-helix transcriptional regulator n=1 Tax=Rhizobium populisoli TaxID=2859785 RepID=UPI001C669DCB|nr:helix-turn-helix transcriptional regulator [Rhizobium populisoli]MBW6422959.1 helix-turn-helix transcriptional regulator [Rhizobium populisoli]